jgi:predicted acylesterase/phospholipase RssA
MRGVFQACFLKELEVLLGRPLRDCFDLFAGTSTGAIVAVGLALGVEPDAIFTLFDRHGPAIFKPRPLGKLRRGPRYSAAALRRALVETLGERTLGDCVKADPPADIYVPAVSVEEARCRAFTTLAPASTLRELKEGRGQKEPPDWSLPAVDVVMASCAAPTYFPPVRPAGDRRHYLDGGLGANAPGLWAALEAHAHKGCPFADMWVVSVGNGEVPVAQTAGRLTALRPWSLGMLNAVLETLFAAQQDASDQFLEVLIPAKNLYRVNTPLGKWIELDDARAALEELPARAEQLGRNWSKKPHFEQLKEVLLAGRPAC